MKIFGLFVAKNNKLLEKKDACDRCVKKEVDHVYAFGKNAYGFWKPLRSPRVGTSCQYCESL